MKSRSSLSLDLTMDQYRTIETWQPGAGKILRDWRRSRGWSTRQLADRLYCTFSSVAYWELEKKRPTGSRRQALLALMAPRNVVPVYDPGFLTSAQIDAVLARLEAKYESPIERRFFLLDSNYEKVLLCLILKCTGTLLLGADVKAISLYLKLYDDVRREYELSRQKSTTRQVSEAGQRWLRGKGIYATDSGSRNGMPKPDSTD